MITKIPYKDIKRDKNGYWLHPEFYKIGVSDPCLMLSLEFNLRYAVKTEKLEWYRESPAYLSYIENFTRSEPDISEWDIIPSEPDGYFLIGIHDTEDGPYAWFARKIPEHPAIFMREMVQAILNDQKAMTRRIVKKVANHFTFGGVVLDSTNSTNKGKALFENTATCEQIYVNCPYGKIGDRLWVKETTLNVEDFGWQGPVYLESKQAKEALLWGYGSSDDPHFIEPYDIKKRSSLFMSRATSRILLEIVNIKVERLNDISEADAIKEGVTYEQLPENNQDHTPAKTWFRGLWESMNGAGSWSKNPWVWAIEFDVILIKDFES